MKLANAASFIYHQHTVTATKLTFLSAPVHRARLMQVPLIPAETLNADANLVIKMVIGTDIRTSVREKAIPRTWFPTVSFLLVFKHATKTITKLRHLVFLWKQAAATLLVVIVVMVRLCQSLPSLTTREGSRPSYACLTGGEPVLLPTMAASAVRWFFNTSWILKKAYFWKYTLMTAAKKSASSTLKWALCRKADWKDTPNSSYLTEMRLTWFLSETNK